MQAPLPDDEVARLEILDPYKILDTEAKAVFDDLARLAVQICNTPVALISLFNNCRQWFKALIGLQASKMLRDLVFCNHASFPTEVLIVPDALGDERFATSLLVTAEPYIRFYVSVPLVTAAGQVVGTLCVIDYVPRELSPMQVEALQALGRQIMMQLELR
ncbi:MAG TPA: GAF domain-containing protein, partial [Candidatus Caenarcaniphilales bacterium]